MEEKYKKYIIILFISLGLISLVISTRYYIITIPKIDRNITESENIISSGESLGVVVHILDFQRSSNINNIILLNELNASIERMADSLNVLRNSQLEELYYLYVLTNAHLPDDTIMEKWDKMDIEKLDQEINNTYNPHYIGEVAEQISQLTQQRDTSSGRAIKFQIFGLLLTQVSLILQIFWFEGEKEDKKS
jgi:hypothetical protein